MNLFPRRTTWTLALVLTALAAVALASCGGDDENDTTQATSAERAFLEGMVPHHESAVDMAKVAQTRAEHPQVSELANAIVTAQQTEIAQMKKIHERLFGEALRPDEGAHEQLGLSADEAGMMMGEDAAAMLTKEKPFDRAFIDEMVPHHQGAIRMARAILADSKDDEVRGLAEDIVSAQSTEIGQMNRWRTAWYGSASPAGGVPKAGEPAGMEDMEGMEH